MKRLAAYAIGALLCATIAGCGGAAASLPAEMVGSWSDGKTYSTFPISELDFEQNGNVTLHMDGTYHGTVHGGNGSYSISVEGGNNAISDVTVDEVKDGLDITVEDPGDGTLVVHVSGKNGYYYMGPESEVFEKA